MKTVKAHISLYFLSCLLSGMAFISCLDSEDLTNLSNAGEGDKTMVTFSLQLPGKSTPPASQTQPLSSNPVSRALNEADENEVTEIDVLLFKPTGEYRYTAQASSITPDAGNVRKKNFTVMLPKGNFDLIILANSSHIIHTVYSSGIPLNTLKRTVLESLVIQTPVSGKWGVNTADANYKCIPMWGYTGAIAIDENTALTGESNAVKLTRMLARVDVNIIGDALPNFQLADVRVYNRQTHGSLIALDGWDGTGHKAVTPNVPSVSTRTLGPLVYTGDEITTTDAACVSEIYLFESDNLQADGTTPIAQDDRSCLVVCGTYTPDGKTYYYRVDFSQKTGNVYTYLDLLRNHWYRVNITKVSGPGYHSSQEAFEALPINIETNIVQWNDADISDIVIDGQYMLGVSQSEYSFTKEAHTNNELIITTDFPDGWSAAVDAASVSWLSIESNANGNANASTILKFNVTENTLVAREGKINITAGRLIYTVTVKQSIQSAPFLTVAPAIIPSVSFSGGSTQSITVTSSDPWTASIATSNDIIATFNGGSSTSISGVSGGTFTVTFPQLLLSDIIPVAVVTIKITGTNVEKTLVVPQKQLATPNIGVNVLSTHSYYGSLIPGHGENFRINTFMQYLYDEAFFGPTGRVSSGLITSNTVYYIATPSLLGSSRIFMANGYTFSASQSADVKSWRADSPYRVLIVDNEQHQEAAVNSIIGATHPNGYGFAGADGVKTVGAIHTLHSASISTSIMNFLLDTGPFTMSGSPILPASISLKTGDGAAGIITLWPSTFVPIIMHPTNTNGCVFGIDPTLRIVYMGDPEIFSTNASAASNWTNENNVKFLQNIIAWMVNVTQYGDDFTNQFR